MGSNLPGAWIDLTPPDMTLDEGGFANFVRNFPRSTEVTLSAPGGQLGWVFVGWNLLNRSGPFTSNGVGPDADRGLNPLIRSRTITLPIDAALEVVQAIYEPGPWSEPDDAGPDPSNGVPRADRGASRLQDTSSEETSQGVAPG